MYVCIQTYLYIYVYISIHQNQNLLLYTLTVYLQLSQMLCTCPIYSSPLFVQLCWLCPYSFYFYVRDAKTQEKTLYVHGYSANKAV